MQSKKSGDDILMICNHGELWSPKSKNDAIYDIEKGLHSYYLTANGLKFEIKVIEAFGKKLVTDPDINLNNYLLYLPDC